MGGLLIGHVDHRGSINVVTGFFLGTQGLQVTAGSPVPGAAGGCFGPDANSLLIGGVPRLRIVGWIHTHPDLGLFLSSTDVSTYSALRGMVPDSKFTAVVIDPLRGLDGVFPSERHPNTFYPAEGEPELDEALRNRYHRLLDRLQEVRDHGWDRMPGQCPRPGGRACGGDRRRGSAQESVHF